MIYGLTFILLVKQYETHQEDEIESGIHWCHKIENIPTYLTMI